MSKELAMFIAGFACGWLAMTAVFVEVTYWSKSRKRLRENGEQIDESRRNYRRGRNDAVDALFAIPRFRIAWNRERLIADPQGEYVNFGQAIAAARGDGEQSNVDEFGRDFGFCDVCRKSLSTFNSYFDTWGRKLCATCFATRKESTK